MRSRRILLAVSILAAGATVSCLTDPAVDIYHLAADSISAPDTVTIGDTLFIRIHYTLIDGCHSLKRVESTSSVDGLTCRLIGRKIHAMCDDAVRYRSYLFTRPDLVPGIFTISVDQPEGADLVRQVVVLRDKGEG
jgi:hypothetical protein